MADNKVHYSFKTTDERVVNIWNLAKMKKKVLLEEALIYYYENHKNISGLFESVEQKVESESKVEPKKVEKVEIETKKDDLTWEDVE